MTIIFLLQLSFWVHNSNILLLCNVRVCWPLNSFEYKRANMIRGMVSSNFSNDLLALGTATFESSDGGIAFGFLQKWSLFIFHLIFIVYEQQCRKIPSHDSNLSNHKEHWLQFAQFSQQLIKVCLILCSLHHDRASLQLNMDLNKQHTMYC